MIWTLLKKDLLRKYHEPGGFIILVLLPLLLTLIMGLAFGPGGEEQKTPTVKLLVEDHDGSVASQFLLGAFSRGQLAKMFEIKHVEKNTGREMMDKGKASALLIIPAGFGDSLLARYPVELILVKNPGEQFLPKIAEETLDILAEGGDRLLRLAAQPIELIKSQIHRDQSPSDAQVAAISIQFKNLFERLGTYFFPPLITLNISKQKGEEKQSSGSILFAFFLAGSSLMALLFIVDVMARDFFRERDKRTLHRLLVGPASPAHYIAAKILLLFTASLLALLLVWIAGILFFAIRIAHILSFLTLALLIAAAFSGLIALMYALARTRAQIAAMAPAIIIVFSMIGGAMIPFDALPVFMQKMAVISPVWWGVDGLHKITISQAGPSSLTTHFLALAVFAVVMNVGAFVIFAKKVRL